MPQAIVAAATYISAEIGSFVVAAGGSIATAGTVADIAFAAIEVTSYAAIALGINAAFAPKPPALGAVSTPYKAGIPPRQSGFGRTRIAGPYMLFEAAQGGSFDVVALHDGECDDAGVTANPERVFMNDDEVTVNPATGACYSTANRQLFGGGPPGHKVYIQTRLGLTPQVALSLPMALDVAVPGMWTALHRGDGIACLALTCAQSKKKDQQANFPNGVPQPSVVMRLQKVFDPRLGEDQSDTSSYAWSANPVLALLKYLTNAPGGMGLDYARRIEPVIDDWKAAADDCDREMQLLAGGTEPRYACGGLYSHETAPSEVINQLLQSFDGWLSQRGDGALVVRPGRYIAPTVTFTDDHVTAYSVQHFLTDEEAVNQLVPSFTDPNSKYNVIDAGAWTDAADFAARCVLRSQTLPLVWVQSPSQARRIAKRRMSRLTAQLRGTITTNLYGFVGLGERYLRLKVTENAAIADLIVEVANVNMDLANLSVTFDWVQADPDIDAWNRFSDENPATDVTARGDNPELTAPTITAAAPVYDNSGGGVAGTRLQLTVTAPIAADVEWLVRWRVSGGTDWTEADYSDIADGASVSLATGFVTSGVTVEVETAYRTAGALSPWSPTFDVVTDPPAIVVDHGFGVFAGGLMADNELLGTATWGRAITFASGNPDDTATAQIPATALAVIKFRAFDIHGAAYDAGTLTFAAGAATGTIAWTPTLVLAAGAALEIRAPSPADATLASVRCIANGTE